MYTHKHTCVCTRFPNTHTNKSMHAFAHVPHTHMQTPSESENNYASKTMMRIHLLQNHALRLGRKHFSRFRSKNIPFKFHSHPYWPLLDLTIAFKKTLYSLYEKDNRPLAAVKYRHSSTVDRQTSFHCTTPHSFYT